MYSGRHVKKLLVLKPPVIVQQLDFALVMLEYQKDRAAQSVSLDYLLRAIERNGNA
jgi:hypothetical protein